MGMGARSVSPSKTAERTYALRDALLLLIIFAALGVIFLRLCTIQLGRNESGRAQRPQHAAQDQAREPQPTAILAPRHVGYSRPAQT